MKKPLSLEGARALSAAGAITDVQIITGSAGLHIELNKTFLVANREGKTRHFAKADTALGWLKEIGINRVHGFDLAHWGEVKKPTAPKRVTTRR